VATTWKYLSLSLRMLAIMCKYILWAFVKEKKLQRKLLPLFSLFISCQISDKVNRDQTHTVEILGELSGSTKINKQKK
jgi:hypothetical protein